MNDAVLTHAAGRPRSLHVIGGKGLGGAERFYIRLVNALARRGEPVAAVTVAGGEIARAIDPAVHPYHAPMLGVWDLYSRRKINRAIADFRPDVVQTYMGRATRIVRLPNGGRPVHLARLGGYYNLKGYRHAHAWVGNTRGIGDYLVAHGLPADRVSVIGNFVDSPGRLAPPELDALRRRLGLDGCRVLVGLGRLHPNKGWADLLHAFAKLPDSLSAPPLMEPLAIRLSPQAGKSLVIPNPDETTSHSTKPASGQVAGYPPLAGEGANVMPKPINAPLHLLMVGDGPLRKELESLAGQLGIASRVHWAGWKHDPAPYYQLADVFVCASVHEPLGNVILEAWANRALLVSTRAQGPLELMQDGVNGLLAPLSDAAGLAEVLHTALALDAAHRARLIDAGHDEVEKHYSEAAIVSAYVALYAGLRDEALPDAAMP